MTATRSIHHMNYTAQCVPLYECPNVTERHTGYMCPSLAFDMSLCLYQGRMDTGVRFHRNRTFILSTTRRDRLINTPLCLAQTTTTTTTSLVAFISAFCPHPSPFSVEPVSPINVGSPMEVWREIRPAFEEKTTYRNVSAQPFPS